METPEQRFVCLRARNSNRPVGYLKAAFQETPSSYIAPIGMVGPAYVLISDCKVDDAWRRFGIGTRLVSEALRRMRAVLPPDAIVYGWVDEPAADVFWMRFGFEIVRSPDGRKQMQAALKHLSVPAPPWATSSESRE